MVKEFKAFLMRGNVVDLAVAVVIGDDQRHVGKEDGARERAARQHRPAAQHPAGLQPRCQRVVLVRIHRRGRRLPLPQTAQALELAHSVAKTMPGRPRTVFRARIAR
jgi:Large-conductance mechanosensitive channel, MscL